MTDLQELIAMGPIDAALSIPPDVLSPRDLRLRSSEPPAVSAAFTDSERSQLRALGVDLEQLGI
jgi:hypothetical protein